jgi:hypothetical protein
MEEVTGDGENCIMWSCMMCTTKYYSGDQIKEVSGQGMCHIWGRREMHRGLLDKPEGNRPLASLKPTCEDNIRLDFRETGWESTDRIDLVQRSDKS